MEELMNKILSTYNEDGKIKVDSTQPYYDLIVNSVPAKLRKELSRGKYTVKGSSGQGSKASNPWIVVFNNNITNTGQKGIFIVYLFRADMSGFYLTLNQGMNNFKNLYKKESYVNARLVADYFRGEIGETAFSKKAIYLNDMPNTSGYGYQQTNIVSKFYKKDNFTSAELITDFKDMLAIYDEIYKNMYPNTSEDIIKLVIGERI